MTSKLLTATALAFTFALGAQGAFAQDAVTCEGLTIVSVTPSGISSQIDGEFTVYSFDLTATIESADGDFAADAPVTATLSSGDNVIETLEIAELAGGEQVTLETEAKNWSPYTDYGFVVALTTEGGEATDECSVNLDGSTLEQLLRGN